MSVKWSIIKALTCFLLVCSSTGYAQEANTITIEPRRVFRDTVIITKHDTVWLEKEKVKIDSADISNKRSSRYDKRVHRYRKHWESLIPTHTKLQFAGNMGLLSLGTGWDYGKRNQWETDIFFGILPKYDSKRTKITMTLKQNYMPWSILLEKNLLSNHLHAACISIQYSAMNFGHMNPNVIQKVITASHPRYAFMYSWDNV